MNRLTSRLQRVAARFSAICLAIFVLPVLLFGVVGTTSAARTSYVPLPAVAPTGSYGGIVSFTFDDGMASQYANGLSIANANDIDGTLFLTSGGPNSAEKPGGDWSMTWDQVREFHESGWEIGSHSVNHPRLSDIPLGEVELELSQSYDDILRNIGIEPVSFATPHGAFNEGVVNLARKYYQNHLGSWGGNEGRNPRTGVNHFSIHRLDVEQKHTAEQICREMELAVQNNVWLVLIFHRIVEGQPAEYEIAVETFDAILKCAVRLAKQGDIKVATVKDALREIPHIE